MFQWAKDMWYKERLSPGVVYSEDYLFHLKQKQRAFTKRMTEMEDFEMHPERFAEGGKGSSTHSFWGRLKEGCGDVKGVMLRALCVGSGDVSQIHEVATLDFDDPALMGSPLTRHILLETAPPIVLEQVRVATTGQPSPEDSPYTIWERLGLVPIHLSRLRPRQYYMPTTDFSKYEYDEGSSEEHELRARWLSKLYMFDMMVPGSVLAFGMIVSFPFHTFIRLPLFLSAGISGCMIEISRCYVLAMQERQDLDDFLLAKEIWYIKNEEVYELGLPTIPRGQERYYQTRDGEGGEYRVPGGF